ncbi:LOW QUALITY PROTEIN: hypothetical protein MKX08_002989 [Trichoderma sp. CBMAI-0020]|nr:LOW QUALITY PROTEIN: hypothetical protein MKX08_002989 [Trichoderma sp. CBMAI-0020]
MKPKSASLESVTLFGHQTGDRSGSSGAKSGPPGLATAQNQIPQVPAGFRVPFQAMHTDLEGDLKASSSPAAGPARRNSCRKKCYGPSTRGAQELDARARWLQGPSNKQQGDRYFRQAHDGYTALIQHYRREGSSRIGKLRGADLADATVLLRTKRSSRTPFGALRPYAVDVGTASLLRPSSLEVSVCHSRHAVVPCQALGIRAAVRLVAGRAIQISDARECLSHGWRPPVDLISHDARTFAVSSADTGELSASRAFVPKQTMPTGTSTASLSLAHARKVDFG